jgi:hypothetical protein
MSQVHPTVRYLIICEDVQIDPENPHRVTLVGLLSAIRSLEQPPPSHCSIGRFASLSS